MKPLTIVYITSRQNPQFDWFMDSLRLQPSYSDNIDIIVVDTMAEDELRRASFQGIADRPILHVLPKPSIWQGKHRILKEDHWAIGNAKNSGICLCKTEWCGFCDDRAVLRPTWLEAISDAMAGNYAVAGAYEKRYNMVVEKGVIKDHGTLDGSDPRMPRRGYGYAQTVPGSYWFGCTGALPLEWALQVNGVPEDYCDGLGMEDVMFGALLQQNNLHVKYDPRMFISEDRTPSLVGPAPKRSDFGKSPEDKSHGILKKFNGAKTSLNSFDIRAVRDLVLSGNPFPPPSASHIDWWDGADIATKFNAL